MNRRLGKSRPVITQGLVDAHNAYVCFAAANDCGGLRKLKEIRKCTEYFEPLEMPGLADAQLMAPFDASKALNFAGLQRGPEASPRQGSNVGIKRGRGWLTKQAASKCKPRVLTVASKAHRKQRRN